MRIILFAFLSLITVIVTVLDANPAHARRKYASLTIDADTGVVLHEKYAGERRHPASLTKLMTLYLTFKALDNKKLRLNQKLRVSSRASAQPASKLGLRRGKTISVRDAILSIVVKSANDSAVVLAESIGGSEWKFVTQMNKMTKRLGLDHTKFMNASGLHHSKQITTAYDMARLAVALKRDFPKYYHYFNRTKFYYRGKHYVSHNYVTRKYRGSDGMKTGYIRASGYNLVSSAHKNGRHVVGVVLGGKSSKRRDREMVKLLDKSFYTLAKNQSINSRIYARATPAPERKPGSNVTALIKPTIESRYELASLNKNDTRINRAFTPKYHSTNKAPIDSNAPTLILKPGSINH